MSAHYKLPRPIAPAWVHTSIYCPETTSYPGYPPMLKNATILATREFMRESCGSNTLQGKRRPSCARGFQARC
jgi:hypothetical protein